MSSKVRQGHKKPVSGSPAIKPLKGDVLAGTKGLRGHFVLLSAVIGIGYLLSFSTAHFGRISDGEEMVQTALSIYEFRELSIFNKEYHSGGDSRPATYSKYGLGFPLVLQIPIFLADHLEAWFGWKKTDYLFGCTNLILILLIAILLAAAARCLGFGRWAVYLAAFAFAFGSFAWPYISYDFSEPLQAFCLILAFWALLRVSIESRSSWIWLVLSGLALGFGILTKSVLAMTLPAFVLYLWWRTRGAVKQRIRAQLLFLGPLMLMGIVIAVLNLHRFQSIVEFGYGEEAFRFTTPLWTGLYGLVLSPSKGMLFYAPVTLLLPLGLRFIYRRRRDEFIFFCLLFALLLLPISKWWSWEGGSSWGPRLLYPLLPFLVLFSVCAADIWKAARYCLIALLAMGVAVNLMGILFYFSSWGTVIASNGDLIPLDIEGRAPSEYQLKGETRYFYPYVAANYMAQLSPIIGHAWMLRWRYLGSPFPISFLERQPPVEKVHFGPVSIDFVRLKEISATNPLIREDLLSARLLSGDILRGEEHERALPVRGKAFFNCGLRFLGQKDFSKAYYSFHRADELGFDSPGLLPNLGIASFRLGKTEEGSGYFDRYLERFPAEHNVRLFYAQILEANRLYGKALEQYLRLKQLRPDHPQLSAINQRIAVLSQVTTHQN